MTVALDPMTPVVAGDDVDPTTYYFRTTLSIETAAPEHADLEHAVFVASCIREASTVRYTAYRVT